MKKIIRFSNLVLLGVLFSFTNVEAAAGFTCTATDMKSVAGIINWASCLLIKTVVPFLFSLATVAFIWGVIQFYLNPENEEKRKKGKSFIVGGLIALFVMVTMWGLVNVLVVTFGGTNTIPQLPGQ